MSVTESTMVSFGITGEFITKQAKDFMLENRPSYALSFLVETCVGMTFDQAIGILKGDSELVGDSREDNIGLVEVEERDEEYQEGLDYAYGRLFVPQGGDVAYRPYGYVSHYSSRDFENSPNREMFYAYNADDISRTCLIPGEDGLKGNYAVLFEKVDYSVPAWIKPNHSAQVSCDAYDNNIYDLTKAYRTYNDNSDLGFGVARSEKGSSSIISDLTANLKDRGLVMDEKMVNSLLNGPDEDVEYGVSKHEDFASGYIDRKGKFYGCEYAQHYHLADWIEKNVLSHEVEDAQIALDDMGWVRIQRQATSEKLGVHCMKRPTQRQIDAIMDHSEIHGRLDANSVDFFDSGGETTIHVPTVR